ncbi:hypothetical protein Tco_0817546 [Tanacetum coccineum]
MSPRMKKGKKRWREEFEWKRSLFEIDLTFSINAFDLDKGTKVANHGGDELVKKGRPLKRKMMYAEYMDDLFTEDERQC